MLRAIIRGESLVLHIMGTGGGKSMSFMLPAYSALKGVTVVIALLVALTQNLQQQCLDLTIDTHI